MSEPNTIPYSHSLKALDLLDSAAGVNCYTARGPGWVDDGVTAVRDAQVATGHALLAVCEELAGVRAELAALAEDREASSRQVERVIVALERLAARRQEDDDAATTAVLGVVAEVTQPLADIAAAVEALVSAVDERTSAADEQGSRRRWWRWGR
ncbi:hypothetical protein Ssi03_76910 [Sphaerisporangium siamense]|uniref:Uncharacterized protein n=1 Tax=Sphaerisporangium siamense TaxID=795645 RepID=A0A7W7GE03_9ACTN|nr:hypothetical protein [Sphaerisporangium siamense]MBB4706177.1 hypothetical protein [Sphaerisporangium siamense]GII89701.1 hypothetical protein Ssi03_76910 [Sphaerisporangium siamense]